MATHSSILAWRIPWTEEPGGCKELDMTEQLIHTRFLETLACDALFLWIFCFYYKFILLKILFVVIICGLD